MYSYHGVTSHPEIRNRHLVLQSTSSQSVSQSVISYLLPLTPHLSSPVPLISRPPSPPPSPLLNALLLWTPGTLPLSRKKGTRKNGRRLEKHYRARSTLPRSTRPPSLTSITPRPGPRSSVCSPRRERMSTSYTPKYEYTRNQPYLLRSRL